MAMQRTGCFDVRVGDALVCREGENAWSFTVVNVTSGRVSVDVGGIAMPLPLHSLELAEQAAAH